MSGPRRVLVTGGAGRTGSVLVPLLIDRGWDVCAPPSAELDLVDAASVDAAVDQMRPDAIVNLAAWNDLERCEADEAGARGVNAAAVGHLARAADGAGAHLCHVSTDYVFDGEKGTPYVEDDPAAPLSAYARTKLAGEVAAGPDATVVRTAWLAGPNGASTVRAVLAAAARPGQQLRYVADQWSSPTSIVDLCPVLADLLDDRTPGLVHVVNAGAASRFEVAAHVLAEAGHDPARVEAVAATDLSSPAGVRRPRATPLATHELVARGHRALRDWREAFSDLVREIVDKSTTTANW